MQPQWNNKADLLDQRNDLDLKSSTAGWLLICREESSACIVDAAEAAPLQCFHHPLKAQKEEAYFS
jgi:hypothetical protein